MRQRGKKVASDVRSRDEPCSKPAGDGRIRLLRATLRGPSAGSTLAGRLEDTLLAYFLSADSVTRGVITEWSVGRINALQLVLSTPCTLAGAVVPVNQRRAIGREGVQWADRSTFACHSHGSLCTLRRASARSVHLKCSGARERARARREGNDAGPDRTVLCRSIHPSSCRRPIRPFHTALAGCPSTPR